MILRLFVAIIVVLAVVAGILNIYPPQHDMIRLAAIGEFFSAAIPIVAFGALVKYLCACKCCGSIGCKCGVNGCCGIPPKGKCCCSNGKCCCGKDVRPQV